MYTVNRGRSVRKYSNRVHYLKFMSLFNSYRYISLLDNTGNLLVPELQSAAELITFELNKVYLPKAVLNRLASENW